MKIYLWEFGPNYPVGEAMRRQPGVPRRGNTYLAPSRYGRIKSKPQLFRERSLIVTGRIVHASCWRRSRRVSSFCWAGASRRARKTRHRHSSAAATQSCRRSNQRDEATAAVIAQQVKEADALEVFRFNVLALGDLAYDRGSTNDFKCFDASWGTLLKLKLGNSDVRRLMLPVPGNREYVQSGALPYYTYFEKAKNPWVFQQETNKKKKQLAEQQGLLHPPASGPGRKGPWSFLRLNSELRVSST